MKKLLFAFPLIFVFISCGASDKKSDRTMEKGESYSVSHGDKIIQETNNTLIEITHINKASTSAVSLIRGKAIITHPKQK